MEIKQSFVLRYKKSIRCWNVCVRTTFKSDVRRQYEPTRSAIRTGWKNVVSKSCTLLNTLSNAQYTAPLNSTTFCSNKMVDIFSNARLFIRLLIQLLRKKRNCFISLTDQLTEDQPSTYCVAPHNTLLHFYIVLLLMFQQFLAEFLKCLYSLLCFVLLQLHCAASWRKYRSIDKITRSAHH